MDDTSYCSRSVGRSVRHTSKVTYITQLCQNNALSLKQHTHGRACGRLKQVPTTPPMHPLQPPTTRDDHESPGEAREAKHRKDLKMHDFTPTHLKLVLKIPACNSLGGSNIRSILEAKLAHKSIRLGYAYFASYKPSKFELPNMDQFTAAGNREHKHAFLRTSRGGSHGKH